MLSLTGRHLEAPRLKDGQVLSCELARFRFDPDILRRVRISQRQLLKHLQECGAAQVPSAGPGVRPVGVS